MKKLLLIAAIAIGYIAYLKIDSGPEAKAIAGRGAYIAVYGRDSCGFTTALREYLSRNGIAHAYFSVDDRESADRLHTRMRAAGIDTTHYYLPVVDVSGAIAVRPDPQAVVARYENSRGARKKIHDQK